MRRLRDIAINLSLVLGSVLAVLAVCEFVVFRFIWLASDAPALDFVDEVVRYAPGQQGVWRVTDEIAASYRINAQGWNSGVGDYVRERRGGTARVAVVGDSMVEAMQVASTDSFAEVLGRAMQERGPAEVFRFGMSGAPLSQYVHMVERVVLGYRPDWIVVLAIHNDFDESYRFVQGRYTSSFMKFRIEDGKVIGELPPTPWRPGQVLELVRRSATVRFFPYRWRVRPQTIVDLFLPRPAGVGEGHWAGNVEIDRVLAERREVEAASDHAVARLAALADRIGARLLLVMDGDRNAIYRGTTSRALDLNAILSEAAARRGVSFLDLHPVFAAHWASHHQRLNFNDDAHWNELGHSVVGYAIAERIRRLQQGSSIP